jgi:hypothetical protein
LEFRRVAIGDFSVENAWTLDVVIPLIKKFVRERAAAS